MPTISIEVRTDRSKALEQHFSKITTIAGTGAYVWAV